MICLIILYVILFRIYVVSVRNYLFEEGMTMNKISFNNKELTVFKRALSENTNKNNTHHNPFGISFKGKVLECDVFESSKAVKPAFEGFGKVFASALVGCMHTVKNINRELFGPAIEFVRNINQKVSTIWTKLNETDVRSILPVFNKNVQKELISESRVDELTQLPVETLADMLNTALITT